MKRKKDHQESNTGISRKNSEESVDCYGCKDDSSVNWRVRPVEIGQRVRKTAEKIMRLENVIV
jgi:hypothetical protein